MKKSILTTIVSLICVLILTSCGAATDTSSNITSANTTEPTTEIVPTIPTTLSTTIATTVSTTNPTTVATTAKPHTTAKKTAAKTVAHTAKKTAAKTTKKKVAADDDGLYYLPDADILWAQEKANEYLQTLKGVKLDPSAEGYTLQSGITIYKTKEEVLKVLKEAIDYDYQMSLDADWHDIGMYVKMEKDENGIWSYTIMNECYG